MPGEPPTKASPPPRAAFLSYASQDIEAAKRICDALRAGGIEVWFDQSELRGGDIWDQRIRQQIRECALFLAIISRNTDGRAEGYFRLEWKLAVDRSHLMADDEPFLLPIVVDGTLDANARVPDRFRQAQWARLPNGVTPPAFVERVSRLLAHDPHVSRPGLVVSTNTSAQRQSVWLRFAPLLAAMLVIGCAYFVLDRFVLSKRVVAPREVPAEPAAALAPRSTVTEKSIAVLPFVDMSEQHDHEYFSDGLSEELIDRLTHSPDLKVIARTSSFAFKGKSDDVRTIASRLGVANLLEGSVRESGNKLRITAQLIRARDGMHIWSQSFDRNEANIFRIQEEIAATVAAALQTALSASATIVNTDIRPDAYDAFLQGKYFYERDGNGDLDRSVAEYQEAIRLEPDYALAWVGLGRAFNMMGLGGQLKPSEAYKRAREAVSRALQISPDLAEAHRFRGALLMNYEFDFREYKAEVDRAVELDPHLDLGSSLVMDALRDGRTAVAVHEARRLIDRDPLTAYNYEVLSWALRQDSHFEEAETALNKARELNPTGEVYFASLASIAMARNEPAEALELLGHETDEVSRQSGTIDALWMLGRRREADRLLDVFEHRYGDRQAFNIAESYVLRGDLDAAFRWLDRAYRNHEPILGLIRGVRAFRDLHDDPRYKALLRKMNLPE